jgi:microcystin-dependent protein
MAFAYPVTQPVKQWNDLNGKPLDGGYIYFGTANQNPETTPIQMYWDAAGLIPAAQPARTVGGSITRQGTPANIYATGDFSITVRASDGTLVFTFPTSTDLQLALAIAGGTIAASIPLADADGHYTTDNVEAAFKQVGDPGFVTLARLAAAVQALLVPTGSTVDYAGLTAPTGWVLADGKTIGSAASGGTERANADTLDLFVLLWGAYANTELVIQDSAGTPTIRGASASNDFAANKRMPLPDCRGRVRACKDNLGGSTASRLTVASLLGTTMGLAGGTETHVITAAQLAAHTHTGPSHVHTGSVHTHAGPSHTHSIAHVHTEVQTMGGSTPFGGSSYYMGGSGNTGAANPATSGADGTGNTGNSSAADTGAAGTGASGSAGTDTAHLNVQPTIIFTAIIKL